MCIHNYGGEIMDIPALSSAMASSKVATNVNIAMLKKAKESMEESGQRVAEMITSTNVNSGSKIDIKI